MDQAVAAARRLGWLVLVLAISASAAVAPSPCTKGLDAGGGGCIFFGQSGVDYNDRNLTVVALPANATAHPLAACCGACAAWNAVGHHPVNCSIGVVLRGAVCALKASALNPVPGRPHATAVSPSPPPSPPGPSYPMCNMELVVLPNASSVDKGAVCLDGSPPAIYMSRANSTAQTAHPDAANKWVLYFKGGGW